MEIRVETHSGYKADEYPLTFRIDERQLEVLAIEDRWYGPVSAYYRVFADDGSTYVLEQSFDSGVWRLTECRRIAL